MEVQELKPGDTLGRYQLLMPIAKGGMGQVWAARQSGTRGFQKLVAVKTIIAIDEDSGNLEEMLFEEASLASQIRHPNVAQTLDLGEQNGTLYLVMEWVDGEPLDFIIRSARAFGGIPIAIAVHLITQALKGLQAAHEAKDSKGDPLGIVHRDISPQNLLVTYSGVVKLVDFGVAKATHQTSQPTTLGQVKGKFAYMSPEQVNGLPIDARADVFAMGIVLYRLTTGKHPFKSDTPAATIHNILTMDPAHPSALAPSYPRELEQVVMKALARNRDERYSSSHEMMLALEQALPASVTTNTEKNTETFLRRLFEKRIAEKREAMQTALKAAGAGSASGASPLFPRSHSTMRAVSVESAGEPSGPSRVAAVALSLPPAKKKWHWSVVLLVAGLAAAFGFGVLRNRNVVPFSNIAALRTAPAVAAQPPPVPSVAEPQIPAVEAQPGASASAETRPADEANPAVRVAPTTSVPGKKPLYRSVRREAVAPVPEATAPVAPSPRSAPAPEPTPGEVDPLNRRR